MRGADFVAPRLEKLVELLLFAVKSVKALLRPVRNWCWGLRARNTFARRSVKGRVAAAETTRWWGPGYSGQVLGSRLLVSRRRQTWTWKNSCRSVDRRVAFRASRALVTSRFFELFALRDGGSREGAESVASKGGRVS